MDKLYCPKCDEVVDVVTELKSAQNTARCFKCNHFIKNIPYEKPMLYVGKYKGKPIEEIDDLNYLEWAIKTLNINQRTRDSLQSRIAQLQFLAK